MQFIIGVIVFFVVFVIRASKKAEQEEAAKTKEKMASKSSSSSTARTSTTTRTTTSAPVAPKGQDPVCPSYLAARETLLSLYRAGSVNEEELMQGNATLYDQYLSEPMEICQMLRKCGIYNQANVEDDGDYAIFFKSEEAAWNACNYMQKSNVFKLVAADKKTTTEWAFIPFETDKYRAEVMIDHKIGLQKMIVREKNRTEQRHKITAEELEKMQIEAFDFTK